MGGKKETVVILGWGFGRINKLLWLKEKCLVFIVRHSYKTTAILKNFRNTNFLNTDLGQGIIFSCLHCILGPSIIREFNSYSVHRIISFLPEILISHINTDLML